MRKIDNIEFIDEFKGAILDEADKVSFTESVDKDKNWTLTYYVYLGEEEYSVNFCNTWDTVIRHKDVYLYCERGSDLSKYLLEVMRLKFNKNKEFVHE
jgi:hypothetical protein